MSRGLDRLARLFVYPSSPDEILKAGVAGLRSRMARFIETYRDLLQGTGALVCLNQPSLRESPRALFELTHSSFEYIVYRLRRFKQGSSRRRDFLVQQIDAILEAASKAVPPPASKNRIPRLYELLEGRPHIDVFPNPEMYRLLNGGNGALRFQKLLQSARKWMEAWNPALVAELDFFVRDYAFSDSESIQLYYRSVDDEPGFIMVAPRRLMVQEGCRYEPGGDVEAILMAAQLIHESRHQKGFYFNRVTDPRPIRYPSGFVKPKWQPRILPAVFRPFYLRELFDLMLSLGYELAFLRFVRNHVPLGSYAVAFEEKEARKKRFFFSLLLAAEQHRKALTPLGVATLDELLHALRS